MRCSVDTCERPSERRGMCNAHYQRQLRHGSTYAAKPIGATRGRRTDLAPPVRSDEELAEVARRVNVEARWRVAVVMAAMMNEAIGYA